MQKINGIIFDMDGTLYSLDRGLNSTFEQSNFGQRIHDNAVSFFMNQFSLNKEDALTKYLNIKTRFNGEVSLGVEKEFGIPRSVYFAATWDLDPSEFVEEQLELLNTLSSLTVSLGLLSAAPQVWIKKVLDFLEVRDIFEPAIFSGEPDIRKPNPQAFLQIAEFWKVPPASLISIGDQEETDILPAKSLGMTTVLISKTTSTSAADFIAKDAVTAIQLLKKENIL